MDFSEIQSHFSPYARIQRVYGDFYVKSAVSVKTNTSKEYV